MKLAIAATVMLSTVMTAHSASAETVPSEDTIEAANDAGLDPVDVAGALNTLRPTHPDLDAQLYIASLAQATPDAPAQGVSADGGRPSQDAAPVSGWPIGGVLGRRIYCIEGIESTHGVRMYNRQPVWNGEHAQGWLGFLPSTAAHWHVIIGNRASEWAGAAAILAQGERFARTQFYGVGAGIC